MAANAALDPIALRPAFSDGLLFSGVILLFWFEMRADTVSRVTKHFSSRSELLGRNCSRPQVRERFEMHPPFIFPPTVRSAAGMDVPGKSLPRGAATRSNEKRIHHPPSPPTRPRNKNPLIYLI